MKDILRIIEFLKDGPKTDEEISEMLSSLPVVTISGDDALLILALIETTNGMSIIFYDDKWTEENEVMMYRRIGPFLFLIIEATVYVIDSDGRLWKADGADVDDYGDECILGLDVVQLGGDGCHQTMPFRICKN